MSENKIPHCPFCGGDAAIQIDGTTYQISYVYCECKSCGSRGKTVAFGFVWKNFEMAKKEAIEHWSKRKPMQEIINRLGKAKRHTPDIGICLGLKKAIEIIEDYQNE